MKKIGLLSLLSLFGVIAFAAFPVETQVILTEGFKLDAWGFIIGILTLPFLIYGLPLALLFINKKNFRKSLALGWLAGLVLIFLIIIIALIGVVSETELLY